MEELEQIIEKKITIYDGLFKLAVILNKHEDVEHYGKCIKKLNKILKILLV